MHNGKVGLEQLQGESFTMEELFDAAKASPWDAVLEYNRHANTNIEFALRHWLEWIVIHKREEYSPDAVYQDAAGTFWTMDADSETGEATGRWIAMGTPTTWAWDVPVRPLCKLVPEGTPQQDSEGE